MTRLHLVALTLVTLNALLPPSSTAIADVAPAPGPGGPRRPSPIGQDPFGAPSIAPRRRPPPPPPQPQPFRPPTAVVLHGKELMGKWRCKGVRLKGDGSSSPYVATITSRPELGGAWVQSSLVEAGPVSPGNYVEYRTYDATAQQWTRLQVTGMTAHATSTSLGEKDGMWTWTGAIASPTGTLQTRDFEKRDSATYKLWGEAMLGGAWQKLYELNCKR